MKILALGTAILCSVSAAALAAPIVAYSPPANFDPMTASNDALVLYGFPAKPPQTDPIYQTWVNIVTKSATRLQPNFQDNYHGVKIQHKPMVAASGYPVKNQTVGSTNWAGYAVVGQFAGGVQSYSSWLVPNVVLPSICNGLGAWQSNWNGFDGFANGNVEQGGTTEAITCDGQEYQPSPWYEAFPSGSGATFYGSVNNGDYVSQTLTVTSTQMQVYFVDVTQQTSYAFTVPLGYTAPLQSVETIAEAPYVNGAQSVFGPADNQAFSSNNDHTTNPSTNPTSATSYNVVMVSPYTGNIIATPYVSSSGVTVYEPGY